jgi:hypothetical protein
MHRKDEQQLDVFSYISPEHRVPQDHPLRSLRAMTDEALQQLQTRFNRRTILAMRRSRLLLLRHRSIGRQWSSAKIDAGAFAPH